MAASGKPMRVLFLLFEGLPATVIDSQVLQHARTMQEHAGVHFEIWAFACSNTVYAASLARRDHAESLAGCPVRVFRGVRPAQPGSRLRNSQLILRELARQGTRFDLIHARTDYTVLCAAEAARRMHLPLLWDCRGDAVAEFVERYQPRNAAGRALARWRAAQLRAERKMAGEACTGALFVSRPLSELCAETLEGKPFWVIPCVAPKQKFFFDPALRAQVRAQLGYTDADRVFVYSGSLAAYQCFDETIALFTQIYRNNENARLLALTPDMESARLRLNSLPIGVSKLMTAMFSDVNGYLNAADIAFLLRAESDVNRVASPTKLAEYCLAGLPIVMTDAVRDAARITAELGNRLSPTGITLQNELVGDRATIAHRAAAMLSREATVSQFDRIYAALSRRRRGTGAPMAQQPAKA